MLDRIRERFALGLPYAELYEALDRFDRFHGLEPVRIRPQDSLALRRESDREPIREAIKRFEDLPWEMRKQLPALRLGLARMRIVSGDLEGGLTELRDLADHIEDQAALREIRMGLLTVALDQRKEDVALEMIRHLTGKAFDGLDFISLLGAGFSGSSWLCREKEKGRAMVLKCCIDSALDAPEMQRLRERQILRECEHPGLEVPEPEMNLPETLESATGGSTWSHWLRPYVSGMDLAQKVLKEGPLDAGQWLPIAWTILTSLKDLHQRGMLHRGLCPTHIILPQKTEGLEAILVDCGETPRRTMIHALMSNAEALVATRLGRAAAKRVPYMGPESTGRPKGSSWFGPAIDLYSFGRVGWFALTGTPTPHPAQRAEVPEPWRSLLESCTEWVQTRRPASVDDLLVRIRVAVGEEMASRLDQGWKSAMISRIEAEVEARPDDGEARARLARTLIRMDRIGEGIEAFAEAIRLKPGQFAFHQGRGLALLMQGKYAEAVPDLEIAANLEPERMEAHANLGNCLAQIGRHQEALDRIDRALALPGGSPFLLNDRGQILLSLGRHADALADFARAARAEPGSTRALLGQARALRHLGRTEEWTKLWDKALRASGNDPLLFLERALVRFEAQDRSGALGDVESALNKGVSTDAITGLAINLHNGKRNPDAVLVLEKALEHQGSSRPLRVLLGEILLIELRWDEALSVVEPILGSPQETAPALHVAGAALVRLGRCPEAIPHLDRAIELDPNLAKSYFQRGLARADRGDFQGAADDFAEAVRLEPEDIGSRSNHATALADLGQFEEAEAQFEIALKQQPGDAHMQLGRARIHALKGDKEAAIEAYGKIIADHPEFLPALIARASLFAEFQRWQDAEADYSQAIQVDPRQSGLWEMRGSIRVEMDHLDEALADFAQAIQLDPQRAEGYSRRARALVRARRWEDALADFTEAVRLEPDNAVFVFERSACLTLLERRAEAQDDLAKAIELDPENAHYRLVRAEFALMRGDAKAALEDLDPLAQSRSIPRVHQRRAHALIRLERFAEAIQEGELALALGLAEDPSMLNNQAWILATCKDPAQRNPERARELAQTSVKLTHESIAGFLDTLAVAEAMCGQFDEALRRARQALEIAEPDQKSTFEKRIQSLEAKVAYNPGDDDPTPVPAPVPESPPSTGG